ncbi:MAG TPA: hypothetical protein VK982_09035 [Bacteroidales bacterium]|jgi:ribosomal protein L37AE/L43A|nr:hypothetical protein [Bacteroidales bacterium]
MKKTALYVCDKCKNSTVIIIKNGSPYGTPTCDRCGNKMKKGV